jgi:hypothetical protein
VYYFFGLPPSGFPLRLEDLPSFRVLGEIAEEFGVQIRLFGGSATRAAFYLAYRPGFDFDLFDLAPFSSDLDLAHSGSSEKTREIGPAIRDRLPFASWCRLSLLDATKWDKVLSNVAGGAYLPLRQIVFATGESIPWPEQAIHDLRDRRVTITRNPDYSTTSFAQEDRTLELFTFFLALNTVAELRDIAGEGALRDEASAVSWLQSPGAKDDARRTAASPRLAARAWQLAATSRARAPLDSGSVIRLAQDWYRAAQVVATLEQGPGEASGAFTVSKVVRGNRFLVPQLHPAVRIGEEAQTAAAALLKDLIVGSGLGDAEIDPAFEVVAIFERLTITPSPEPTVASGESDQAAEEDEDDPFGSTPAGEFLHLAWSRHGLEESDSLTAMLVPLQSQEALLLPPAVAVGGVFPHGSAWLRIDFEALTKTLTKNDLSGQDVSIIVVAARAPEQ